MIDLSYLSYKLCLNEIVRAFYRTNAQYTPNDQLRFRNTNLVYYIINLYYQVFSYIHEALFYYSQNPKEK